MQISLDWIGNSGIYVAVWGSNVKFGEGTNLEVDAYLSYYKALTSELNLDVGIAEYSYHGKSFSSGYNYAETWLKVNYGNSALNFW